MGNQSSASSSRTTAASPSFQSQRPPRSPARPPASPSPPPPPQPPQHDSRSPSPKATASLAIDTPKGDGPSLMPAISITVSHESERSLSPPLSISPPLPLAGSPSSIRATPGGVGIRVGSPVPPSPRSVASRASTVTSVAEREEQSYFWRRMKEQYQERKTARRQSQLGTAGKLGRPCCLAIHSISLKGATPPGAQVHVEVGLSPGDNEQNLLSSPLPPLATPPRAPVASGEIDLQGRVDHVVIPSVTATSTLLLTVLLDHNQPVTSLRYPLADVTATLRPTELRLTPDSHGEGASRARSPSGIRSPFAARRRSESPKPSSSGSGSPPPSAAGVGGDASAVPPPPTLGAVWGELSFFDNRMSGVGWVELVEELGQPVHQRRLLLVTPQAFALLDGPACTLGFTGYPLVHVSHVEPRRLPLGRLHDVEDAIHTHGGGFVTITLSRAEVKAAPGSGHDIVLMVGGEEEAKRWTQVLKRAAHEASYGGDDS